MDIEDSNGVLRVAELGDKITLHIQHIHACMGDEIRPSGLEVAGCHSDMINIIWTNDKGMEDRDLFDAASWPELSEM